MTKETLDRFKEKTNVDIQQFFVDFVDFFDNKVQNIYDFYVIGAELQSDTVNALNSLNLYAKQLRTVYNTTQDSLTNYFDDFELLDSFENCCTKIDTVFNSQRWFRSSKGLNFDNKTEKDFVLKQGQTLVNLANEVGYTQPNNDWVNIALRNDLKEEDYTEDGGVKLKIVFQNNSDYKLTSVLDSITGINIYGKDINKKISYTDDDLTVLEYEQTRDQTFSILMNTYRGSIPEFPNDGIDKGLIGSNINSVQYPAIIRQLSDIFAKDDLFKSVGVFDIKKEQDMIFGTVSATTRIGDVLGENLKLVQ
jgi:hypothetical protein